MPLFHAISNNDARKLVLTRAGDLIEMHILLLHGLLPLEPLFGLGLLLSSSFSC